MPHRPRTASLLTAAALLGAHAPAALAQPEPRVVAQERSGAALDISFPGGSMSEFVDALRAGMPGPFNVLLRREAPALAVPPMDLRSVSISTAFELALPQQGYWTEPLPDGGSVQHFREFQQIGGDRDSVPVYVIDAYDERRDPPQPDRTSPGSAPKIEVYSVERAVKNDADVRNLLTAIDTALDLGSGGPRAEVKYHPDAALLIVRGTQGQVGTIERVIDSFNDTASFRENERVARAIQLTDLRTEIIERRADVQRSEAELHMSLEELKELRKLVDSGAASNRQLIEGETRLRLAETVIETARARYEAAEQKLSLFESGGASGETESRTYELGASDAARRVAFRIFEELASVSAHIHSVRRAENARGELVASIEADNAGRRALEIMTQAIRHGSQLTGASTSHDPGASWGWTRELWGQEFHDSLVP